MKHPKCRLAENEIEIIRDDESGRDNPSFIVVDNVATSYVECSSGSIDHIQVSEEARECGIGTMLMQLCLNEEEIHNVANNNFNYGVSLIRQFSETYNVPYAKEVGSWVNSNCEKLVSIDLDCSIPPSVHVFFSSALASGYTDMIFALITLSQKRFYPMKTLGSVKEMKKHYTDDGYILESDGNKVELFGEIGLFCQPRNPNK